MKSIENQLIEELESLNKRFAENEEVKKFEKISNQFDKLVEKGVTQKRGYHLLSPTDAHIKTQVWFNAK